MEKWKVEKWEIGKMRNVGKWVTGKENEKECEKENGQVRKWERGKEKRKMWEIGWFYSLMVRSSLTSTAPRYISLSCGWFSRSSALPS